MSDEANPQLILHFSTYVVETSKMSHFLDTSVWRLSLSALTYKRAVRKVV